MGTNDELIASWSKDKLDLLNDYLVAYARIMQSQKEARGWLRGFAYVDAFASVGGYLDPETGGYVDGSPVVALKCDPPFDRFWFIELSRARLDRLRQETSALTAGRDVHYERGEANRVLVEKVIPNVRYADYQRGFVFLDPYGLEVRWDTVCQLAAAKSFDVFMNLSTMGIARLLNKRRLPTGAQRQPLDAIIGNGEWVDALYSTQLDLFGDQHTTRPHIRHEHIAAAYTERVRKLFPYVSEPVVMKNSKGASLYVLFLDSHNPTAMRITNHIFARYERLRSVRV